MIETKYQCLKCGHICTENEMGADYCQMGDNEIWSNWICPSCGIWGEDVNASYPPYVDKEDVAWKRLD